MPRAVLQTAALLVLHIAVTARARDLGLAVPEGFEVSLYADDDLAHDIFSMTIDARGRVVVAGQNYVKTLEDTDGDGRADRASEYSNIPASGAHGMYFDGPDLICTGDNAIMRLIDRDGDGRADDKQVWAKLRHPEHGANGLVRGPDGWYYLICGNDSGANEEHATLATSPIKSPRSGVLMRFSPDGKGSEILAHGFRNPYDVDIGPDGHIFTVDSDGERDHHLPWYTPTRLFDITQGMEHGWLLSGWTRSWSRPEYFFDNVDRVAELGRGSPTGLKVYRHRQFPEKYRGGVFSACWTLGRVYFLPLEEAGSSFRSQPEVFLQTTGEVGFAPVDLAVGPEGDLYIAIGGRRTRGSVFRVRYKHAEPIERAPDRLTQVLQADEPLTSWSRAVWVPLAKQLGRSPLDEAVVDESRPSVERVRAIEVLTELFGGIEAETCSRLAERSPPEVVARAAWSLSRQAYTTESVAALVKLTHHADLTVQRTAWEALARVPADTTFVAESVDSVDWGGAVLATDRRVRMAAILAARRHFSQRLPPMRSTDPVRLPLAELWVRGPDAESALAVFENSRTASHQLEAVRLMQLALGDIRNQEGQAEVYAGYQANQRDAVGEELRAEMVSELSAAFGQRGNGADLDRELARTLGMLSADAAGTPEKIASMWTPDSPLTDDLHYLIVLSLLPGKRSDDVTLQTANALCRLHHKMEAGRMFPSRNWPARVGEAYAELLRRDPALAVAIPESPYFGLPEHALFVEMMPAEVRPAAARRLLAKVIELESDWTPELIEVLQHLPREELMPHLRERWDEYLLRDSISLVLARHPEEQDRQRLLEALSSVQPAVVERAATALRSLTTPGSAEELATVLRALRQQSTAADRGKVRTALIHLLQAWSGEAVAADDSKAFEAWSAWFAVAHPDQAKTLVGFSAASAEDWNQRLAQVNWEDGDVANGQGIFQRKACHRCHVGSSRLGPDLAGVGGRFSREDLLGAIVDPNREVAPLYQTTQLITDRGEVYNGLIVYESPDGTLLQTGPDTTVRVTNVQTQRPSNVSIMPTGLLDDLTDRQLADLYAYLRTLKK